MKTILTIFMISYNNKNNNNEILKNENVLPKFDESPY